MSYHAWGIGRVRLSLRHDGGSAKLVNLFLRAFLMSLLQSAGVVALASRSPLALGSAFLISFFWASNSRAVVDTNLRGARVAYGLGGMMGAAVTLTVAGLR